MNPSLKKQYARPIRWGQMIKMKGCKKFLLHLMKRELFRVKIASLYYFKKHSHQKKVFFLTGQRTGSCLFISYLNCLPGVRVSGEVLSNNQPKSLGVLCVSKKAAYRHLRHYLNHLNQPLCGAKLMFSQLQMRGISLKELQLEFPEARWLVLYRRNILDQYISYQMAQLTNQWYLTCADRRPKIDTLRIELDCRDAVSYRDWILQCYGEILDTPELLKRSLWIAYEDMVLNPQKVFEEFVFPYLGLKSSAIQSKFLKQNIWQHSEIISNFNQVKNFIAQTSFLQDYDPLPGKNNA